MKAKFILFVIPLVLLFLIWPIDSQPGYFLIPFYKKQEVALIGYNSKVINKWNIPSDRARLLEDCNLLSIHARSSQKKDELRRYIKKYNWQGEELWLHKSETVFHHDFLPLSNSNIITLEKQYIKNKKRGQKIIYETDLIKEVNSAGEVLWSWQPQDYYDFRFFGANRDREEVYKRKSNNRKIIDWTHINSIELLPENNLLLTVRNWWMIIMINRDSGETIWSYDKVINPHEASFTKDNTVLIYDNGSPKKRPYSRVIEINPKTKQTIWEYKLPKEKFTIRRGYVQRLENGNTLIANGEKKFLIEVSPDKKIVWEMPTQSKFSFPVFYSNLNCF